MLGEASRKGMNNPQSKLTDTIVRYIRANHELGELGIGAKDLAVGLGVSHSTVGRVARGETWTHVQ